MITSADELNFFCVWMGVKVERENLGNKMDYV